MLHLNLLSLPRSSGRWRFLTSYQLHQILWKAFPGLDRGERSKRFLYRHDEHDDYHSILVQSTVQADWRHVADEAEGSAVRVKAFDAERFMAGTALRFFLRANPVAQRKGYSDGKSRRVVVGSTMSKVAERRGLRVEDLPTREQQQIEWMKLRGASGGFEIESGNEGPICIPGPCRDYVIARTGSDTPMTFTSVDFSGVLRVTDPIAFAETLRYGIGRGKAFGFGLLSVARMYS